MLNLFWN